MSVHISESCQRMLDCRSLPGGDPRVKLAIPQEDARPLIRDLLDHQRLDHRCRDAQAPLDPALARCGGALEP